MKNTVISRIVGLGRVWREDGFMALVDRIWRSLSWRYRNWRFKPYTVTKSLAGEETRLIIPDLFAEGWYVHRVECPELIWARSCLLSHGDIVADCGANIGFTSLFFANCVGNTGHVTGFEALPANAAIAQKNVKLNKVRNCEIINSAIGAFNGSVDFIPYPNGSVATQESSIAIKVPIVTLDSFYKDRNKPNFIKIDVEGHEVETLIGAQEVFESRPNFDIEIHCCLFSDPVDSVNKLFELLPLQDYELYIHLGADGAVAPFDVNLHTVQFLVRHHIVHLFGKSVV